MAFPDEPLKLNLWAAFGADLDLDPSQWSWTDLSARVQADPVTITRGVAVGASSAQTSSATVLLTNADGELTPHRAESAWWPNVDVGVPVRLEVEHETFQVSDEFARTVGAGGWGTATSGQAWTAVASVSNWSVSGGTGRDSISTVNILNMVTLDVALTDFDATYTVTVPAVATGASIVTGMFARYAATNHWYALRTEFNVGGTLTGKIIRSVSGVQTELAAVLSTLTYTAGVVMAVRVQVAGRALRVKFWVDGATEPTAWAAEAYDEAITDPGRVGFVNYLVFGNSNTLPFLVQYDSLVIRQAPHVRLEGYADDWRPGYLPEGGGRTWSTVAVTIAGVSRRLDRGQTPVWSPLRRSLQRTDPAPFAYWPLEDAQATVRPTSAYPGHPPLSVTGVVSFAHPGLFPEESWATRYGSKPLANLAAAGRLDAVVPQAQITDQWAVAAMMQCHAASAGGGNIVMLDWDTPGSVWVRWTLTQTTGSAYEVRAYDTDGTSTLVLSTTPTYTGLNNYQVDATQNGNDIDVRFWIQGTLPGNGTLTNARVTPVSAVAVNSSRINTTAGTFDYSRLLLAGHLRVYNDNNDIDVPRYVTDGGFGILVRASSGWVRELAHERIERLAEEERIPFHLAGDAPSATALNVQQDGRYTDLAEAAANAESGGLLYEHHFGHAYLPRSARYNRPATLTIDLATYCYSDDSNPDEILAPVLDDQTTRTVWTVERTGGAASTVEASAAYIRRRGRVDDSATLDLLGDADTAQHASWRVHTSTPDEMRHPTLPVDLAANPGLIGAWLRCDIGHRVVRVNQPAIAGRGDIDQVIDGYTETLAPDAWTVTANCSPARVWDVAVYDDVEARYDTAGSVLAAAATSTATSLSVATTSGPLWQPGAGLSMDLWVGGEQVRASAVTQSVIAFVAAGAAAHGNNASVSPGLPAGLAGGNLLLAWTAIRSSGAGVPNQPTGWATLLDAGNAKLFGKIAGSSEVAPTITFSGGSAGDDTSAQLAAYSGSFHDINKLVIGAFTQANGSAQDIALPDLQVRQNNALILHLGWKQDDWTSVASPGTEVGEPDTVTGNDQGIVWAHTIQTTAADVTGGSFVVTGGAAAISRGAVVALRADRQTFTVTRSLNDVTKAHPVGAEVRLWRTPTRAL